MYQQTLIWVLWISLGLGVYVYFIFPIILALLALVFGRKFDFKIPESDKDWPVVAYLIACFNEEKEIERKLANVIELDYPIDKLHILVINDGSKDTTVYLANKFAMSHPDHKIHVLDFSENQGKSATLVRGVEWLSQAYPEVEILALTDANALWEVNALKKLAAPFSNPKIGSVSGLLKYVDPADTASGHMEGLYWKYETMLKRLSGRLGNLATAVGSIFALRKSAYKPLTRTRGDDFELPTQVIIEGYASIFIEDANSYEPPSLDFVTEYRRKLRIVGQMIPSSLMLFWRAVTRLRIILAFQLLSHKLLRYLGPIYQIALLVSSALLWPFGIFYQVLLLVQVVFYFLALLGLLFERSGTRPPKAMQLPLYFSMVNLASLIGMLRLIAGRRIHWERNR